MDEQNRSLHLLGISNQKATHIKLKKGTVKRNPHLQVLCPTLAMGGICHRGGKGSKYWFRPKLLVKNFNDLNLQLWMCEGCKDKFLLRANMNEFSLI